MSAVVVFIVVASIVGAFVALTVVREELGEEIRRDGRDGQSGPSSGAGGPRALRDEMK